MVAKSAGWALRHARAMTGSLIRGGGRLDTVSFLVHDFMHASALERDRIEACAFKVMTGEGPVSMCLHNANRDDYILPENQPGVYPEGVEVVKASGCARCSCK